MEAERLQRIADRLLVFLFFQQSMNRRNASDLWQCVALWVPVTFLEIEQALEMLERAEYIALTQKFGRDGPYGPADQWYVITKGGAEAMRLVMGIPSILSAPAGSKLKTTLFMSQAQCYWLRLINCEIQPGTGCSDLRCDRGHGVDEVQRDYCRYSVLPAPVFPGCPWQTDCSRFCSTIRSSDSSNTRESY